MDINERMALETAIKRVKVVGGFQLLAAATIPLYFLYILLADAEISFLSIVMAILFCVLNGVAGYTAYNGIREYTWISILNQYLQVVSFSIGSWFVNYSGLGGVYVIIQWGQEFDLKFSAYFSPGLSIKNYTTDLPVSFISIDIIAVIFLSALLKVKSYTSKK